MDSVGQVIRMEDMRTGYVAIAKFVADKGDRVAPRGQMTREIRHATIIVTNPLDTLPIGVGRALVPGIAAVESAQLLAGESRPQLTMRIGPQFSKFVEDDGMFHGAYGVRTRGQFDTVIRRLKADRFSRQTVVTLWRPDLDGQDDKKDYPCTVMYSFLIRDRKLIMEVVMRSNDVILGLGYDAFQHSRVQIAVASVLGVDLGDYVHHAISLHLYERDLEKVELLHPPQGRIPNIFPCITGNSWHQVQTRARACLDLAESGGTITSSLDPHHQWYVDAMQTAIRHNESPVDVSSILE